MFNGIKQGFGLAVGFALGCAVVETVMDKLSRRTVKDEDEEPKEIHPWYECLKNSF